VSRSIGRGLSYLVLAAVTFVLLFPLLYAISGSLMRPGTEQVPAGAASL